MNAAVKVVLAIVVLVVLVLGYGAVKSNTPEGREKAQKRDAIERCREAQNDQLAELSTRRLMREACDKMAADFERDHGVPP